MRTIIFTAAAVSLALISAALMYWVDDDWPAFDRRVRRWLLKIREIGEDIKQGTLALALALVPILGWTAGVAGAGAALWVAVTIYNFSVGNQQWYAFEYHVPVKDVIVTPKPHDCEWGTAPLGNKNCHYERRIESVRVSKNLRTGEPIVSFNNGRTWEPETIPTEPSVWVSWDRVED